LHLLMELLEALVIIHQAREKRCAPSQNRFIEQSQPELISAHVTIVIRSIENCFCVVLYLQVARETHSSEFRIKFPPSTYSKHPAINVHYPIL
jgi:hypothetical protein